MKYLAIACHVRNKFFHERHWLKNIYILRKIEESEKENNTSRKQYQKTFAVNYCKSIPRMREVPDFKCNGCAPSLQYFTYFTP